jgi:benzaldehyde dehydrogenase (NAD)
MQVLIDADTWLVVAVDAQCRAPQTTPSDVAAVTSVAADRRREWAARPDLERAAVLRRAGELWEEHAEEIAHWLTMEAGSIVPKAAAEIHVAAQERHEAAARASAPFGEVLRSAQPRLSVSRRLPVGVVGVISPFNFPLILSIRAVAPALALGNAVILKPDVRTAVSGGVVLARIFEEAGLPAGLLSVLSGDAQVGEAVVIEPRIRVIAFTGSTAAGRRVAGLAAEHLKRVHLELGGNNALIVFDDADLDAAVGAGAWGSFFHQGQICMASGRHIVQRGVAREYARLLAERAEKLKVGDPRDPATALGPIIDVRQRDHVHRIVTDSVAQGAEVLAGGTYEGLFYRPTVLGGSTTATSAYAEEIFGPVAPVIVFDTVAWMRPFVKMVWVDPGAGVDFLVKKDQVSTAVRSVRIQVSRDLAGEFLLQNLPKRARRVGDDAGTG